MNTKKITKRDCFETIKTLLQTVENDGYELDYDTLNEFVDNELALLDKKAAAAKSRADKKKAEGDELRDRVFHALNTEEFISIASIVELLDDADVTTHKVTSRLTQLVNAGQVERGEITVSSNSGKNRKITGYRVIVQ